MKIKKIPDSDGVWQDAYGLRYSLLVVRRLRDALGVNEGFADFDSLEDALAAWGLHMDALDRKDETAE